MNTATSPRLYPTRQELQSLFRVDGIIMDLGNDDRGVWLDDDDSQAAQLLRRMRDEG